MLRICIPVHNEATTIGVLLWRLRSVFQGFSREYDVIVYDDASTDDTAAVLEPYQSVMPLTVLRGAKHAGYASSIDALVRHVASDDEYARRDAMVLLQGDFTESPEHLPELVKRFEGGADLVAVHRTVSTDTPADEKRLRRWGRWAVKPFLRMPPVADPFTGFRLVRISVLRDLLKAMGNRPVCAGDGWAANIDFALNVTPFARRIENVEFAPRYDVRQRASRRHGWSDVMALFHWARSSRSTVRPVPGARASGDQPARGEQATVVPVPTERMRSSPPERTERPDRGGRGDRSRPPSDARPFREDRAAEERPRSEERPPREREGRNAREERALRGEERAVASERPAREPREGREAREGRPARPPRSERPAREARAEPTPDETVEQINAESTAPELAVEALSPVESAAIDVTELAATEIGGAKKKRRRRRSRKKGARAADGSRIASDDAEGAEGDEGGPDDGDEAEDQVDAPRSAGTSGDAEGEQDEGVDDGENAESAGGEGGGESARRKRRPRRRRRGRRPGGAEGEEGGGESPAPPAAGPPAA